MPRDVNASCGFVKKISHFLIGGWLPIFVLVELIVADQIDLLTDVGVFGIIKRK